MKVFGIVAEYNPFHNGHKYLIDKARENGADVTVAVMSGNWVQRGDSSIISKFARTRQALKCGVDLVVELPTYWAMSTAQKFARGSIEILDAIGVDTLIFGSECGDVERIITTADCIRSMEFSRLMRQLLNIGKTPASARESAVETITGNGALLRSPNDTLAVEYVSAAKRLDSKMNFVAIKRQGVEHDSDIADNEFCSASKLRELITTGNINEAKKFMPKASFEVLQNEFDNGKISDIGVLEKTILTTLKTTTLNEFKELPDISEGIENRLFSVARSSSTLNEYFENTATKRYTNARLRRLVMSALLKIKTNEIPVSVPYIRVLGCTSMGAEVLKATRTKTEKPIIMRSTELKGDPVFDFETRASDIYTMTQSNPDPCGQEFTNGIITNKNIL